ncbi:MAG: hypothetical protein AAFX65_05885 [Cyanobacteria bacterium J06638_7]
MTVHFVDPQLASRAHLEVEATAQMAAVDTALPQTQAGSDPVEDYFECITTCSLDDGECITTCTELLRDQV